MGGLGAISSPMTTPSKFLRRITREKDTPSRKHFFGFMHLMKRIDSYQILPQQKRFITDIGEKQG
jgi:hypothetical protein